jgi:hypothetical protein
MIAGDTSMVRKSSMIFNPFSIPFRAFVRALFSASTAAAVAGVADAAFTHCRVVVLTATIAAYDSFTFTVPVS